MYWATSFCERENSSKRARMYADSAWWPWGVSGATVVDEDCFIGSASHSTPPGGVPSAHLPV